ncbi:YraN family protein [Ectothiorhodospiraceae bacterium BW-2]|nr:YraN family protein [Ectothiorhodospiraceae bacterium BW-2]
MRSAPQQRGDHYEQQALTYLQQQGCRLLQRNFRCKVGEIDLIMELGEQLLFIEVRYRHTLSHGTSAATVTRNKQQKLIRAAKFWLQYHPMNRPCRFDVIAIDGGDLNWIQHAFEAS